MSTPTSESTPKTKSRSWWLAALVLAVVIGVIAALAVTAENEPEPRSGPSGSVGDPEVKQADWKIDVKRAGKRGKLSKGQKKAFTKQREALRSVTRDVYDAMFLSPEKLDATTREVFTPKARAALKRSKAGLPKGADGIRIRRRSARIAIDVSGSKRATMEVRVVARGIAGGKEFVLEHSSALYLSRDGDRWKAFAFTVDQGPYKKPTKPDDKNGKGNKGGSQKKSGEKKDSNKKGSGNSKKKKGDRS